MKKAPVLFLGHGSPMNIILENEYTNSLVRLGKTLPKPRAVLVVSAHWLTKGTFITTRETPEIIYDFYGFPQELYDIRYPCPGGKEQIEEVSSVFKNASIGYDNQRGLDHAAWAVLKHMYPNAEIPVMELSLDVQKTPQEHYEIARKLAPLREQGFLIIGSGNIVHNLRLVDWDMEAKPYEWAVNFDAIVKKCLLEQNHQPLVEYENIGKDAMLSIPTNEHYLPMLYAAALQDHDEALRFSYEGFQNASMSMRCFSIGDL
ncbi:4,5-DOPA dioxygenase extradiol [Pelosinus sp. UFO1]|uniref:4,5-DOPA-extradiol-dioxygenase n=1 Tax=Pelosinus sp. UFO1 TaxID=484770 RepID=UPI0004D1240E|nr:4,5-DOPA dioxygenase extradiol [Pelosinus sp. UFO1]AIF50896.1 Extradiol ring-cleavage dioxygenase class III protein subunit B [Pelosinus sp. UFO1]